MAVILSHGQADIKREFSINTDFVSYNIKQATLYAYQTVYDGIQQMGCNVHEVVVDKSILKSCKFSRQRYRTRGTEGATQGW